MPAHPDKPGPPPSVGDADISPAKGGDWTPRKPACAHKSPTTFSPPSTPMSYCPALPLPDGSRTVRFRWEGMPLRRCPNVGHRVRGGGGHRGSAGRACPSKGKCRASHRAGTSLHACSMAGEWRVTGPGLWRTWFAGCGPSHPWFRVQSGGIARRSGSVPEHAPKASPVVCPDRGRSNPGEGP